MNNLYLGSKTEGISSVFQLLGRKENDMSYSLAWGLSRCPVFLRKFLSIVGQRNPKLSEVDIYLQKRGGKEEGITDIELRSPRFRIIIEAKRGWNRPGISQLDKYAKRLINSGARDKRLDKRLIVLSEYGRNNSGNRLKKGIRRVPVQPISWREAIRCARRALPGSTHAQKHLINELVVYFTKVMTKQKFDSNEVYVVSIGEKTKNWKLPPVDMVTKEEGYFHPIGKKGFPKEPPNYIAFRYDGKLQSIHHIDKYEVTRDLDKYLKKGKYGKFDHFLYTLGPAIKPNKEVRIGKKINWAGRVWCMLDTLLTSKTISEARDISKKRRMQGDYR